MQHDLGYPPPWITALSSFILAFCSIPLLAYTIFNIFRLSLSSLADLVELFYLSLLTLAGYYTISKLHFPGCCLYIVTTASVDDRVMNRCRSTETIDSASFAPTSAFRVKHLNGPLPTEMDFVPSLARSFLLRRYFLHDPKGSEQSAMKRRNDRFTCWTSSDILSRIQHGRI